MSETTSRMNYTYPSRDEDPWYDSFQSLVTALDSSTYAHREDRALVFAGGGTLSWTLGTSTLTWDDTILVASTISGRRISISADSVVLGDGQILYLDLTRQPLQNISTSFQVADQLPSTNNACAVVVRIGGVVFFRTGISLSDGTTSAGIAPVPSAGGGGPGSDTTAIHDNQAGEIAAIAPKASPTTSDFLVIEDAAGGNAKASITLGDLPPITPASHALGGAQHSSSTLADLNNLISDATLDDIGDPRTDADAIHDDVAGEIAAITSKGSPTVSDLLIIEDVADSNNKKAITIGSLPGGSGTDPDAIHDNVAGEILAITEKTAPVGADVLVLEDSADSNNKKRTSIFNILAGRSVSVRDYGAFGDGVVDDYTAINNAITAIGAAEADLVFPAGTYYIGTNVSLPDNIRPVFARGVLIQDNGDASRTFTVAYSGGIEAGPYQIFNFTGAGSGVVFSNSGPGWLNWWCDGGDGSNTDPWTSSFDGANGLQEAHDSGLTVIQATAGYYASTTETNWTNDYITLKGEGRGATGFIINGAMTYWMDVDADYQTFRDFTLFGSIAYTVNLRHRENVVTAGINFESFDLATLDRVNFEGVLGSAVRFHRAIRSNFGDVEVTHCGDTGKPAWYFDTGTSVDNHVVQGAYFDGIGLEANYNAPVWQSLSSGGDLEGSIANTYDGLRFENATYSMADVTINSGTATQEAVTIDGTISATVTAVTDDVYGVVLQIDSASSYAFGAASTVVGASFNATIDRVDHQTFQLININDRGRHRFANIHINRPGSLSSGYAVEVNFTFYSTWTNVRVSGNSQADGAIHFLNSAYSSITGLVGVGSTAGDTEVRRLLKVEGSPGMVVNGVAMRYWGGLVVDGATSDECTLQSVLVEAAGDLGAGTGIVEIANSGVARTRLVNCHVTGSSTAGDAFRLLGGANTYAGCQVTTTTCAYSFYNTGLSASMNDCHVTTVTGSGWYTTADNFSLSKSTIDACSGHGVYIDVGADTTTITGNRFTGYASSGAGFYGVYLSGSNKAFGCKVNDNWFDAEGNSPDNDLFVDDGYANAQISLNNFINASANAASIGTGANKQIFGNVGALENKLSTTPSPVATSGTGEDDLMSFTLPQDSFNPFEILTIDGAGTKTGTNNNKAIKLYFGASPVDIYPAANDALDWGFHAVITLEGATTSRCVIHSWSDGVVQDYIVFSDDVSAGDITVKVTGECTDVGDTITQTMMVARVE